MVNSETLQQKNKTTEFYSDVFISVNGGTIDPLEGIRTMLASVNIGVGKEDEIVPARMHHWQRWVDNVMNSKLSAVYKAPLRRITRAGRHLDEKGDAVPFFPAPIQKIATSLVCAYIIFNEFQDVDPNTNEAASNWYTEAMAELDMLAAYDGQVGMMELEGQSRLARTPFANPNVMPKPLPKT